MGMIAGAFRWRTHHLSAKTTTCLVLVSDLPLLKEWRRFFFPKSLCDLVCPPSIQCLRRDVDHIDQLWIISRSFFTDLEHDMWEKFRKEKRRWMCYSKWTFWRKLQMFIISLHTQNSIMILYTYIHTYIHIVIYDIIHCLNWDSPNPNILQHLPTHPLHHPPRPKFLARFSPRDRERDAFLVDSFSKVSTLFVSGMARCNSCRVSVKLWAVRSDCSKVLRLFF